MNTAPKQKHCKVKANGCHGKFIPRTSFQKTCNNIACAIQLAQTKEGKEHARKVKRQESRAVVREMREGDLSWWLRVGADYNKCGGNTAYWLHRWICKVRDKDKPCIVCCKPFLPHQPVHAAHYRSRGAAKHLRFHPDNIHASHGFCNTNTTGDTAAKYRANLVDRIGEDRVVELETNNDVHHWTLDECREIRDHYRTLVKEHEAA